MDANPKQPLQNQSIVAPTDHIVEIQRYYVGYGWSHTLLVGDSCCWTDDKEKADYKHWLIKNKIINTNMSLRPTKVPIMEIDRTWKPCGTDDGGWVYCSTITKKFSDKPKMDCYIRKRRWHLSI
ncbi:hypothetical protein BB558_000849 [Smittium angustum]|uniref:Peroxin/Ferlin domain-containing protein n=1 Tax=Smittium angustum TaxID=133377 RepID=A0A2U1JDC5_SMIAN|nr:hypothetical protein BB558_000849 [Smittium angustum]